MRIYIRETFQTPQDQWVFLTKFCFTVTPEGKDEAGKLDLSIKSDKPLKFLMYSDEEFSWPRVYKNKTATCLEKSTLTPESNDSGYAKSYIPVPANEQIEVTRVFHQVTRPRFWYFAISRCTEEKDSFYVEMDMHLTNIHHGKSAEFGFDEMGLVGMHVFFFIAYLVTSLLQMYAVWVLWPAKTGFTVSHALVRLFTMSLLFQFGAVLFNMAYYARYGNTGIGFNEWSVNGSSLTLLVIGEGHLIALISIYVYHIFLLLGFNVFAQVSLILLVFLVGQGWTISSPKLEARRRLTGLSVILLLLYFILFMYALAGRDPASTLYIYDSFTGWFIVITRIGLTLWFVSIVWGSYSSEHNPVKRHFYSLFGPIYSLWFISLPLIVLAAVAVDPWYREKTIVGLTLCTNWLSHLVLLVFLWPTRAYEYFKLDPYNSSGPGGASSLLSAQARDEL